MNPTINQTAQIWCSFCGKSNTDVDKLVAGPGVQICNECTDLSQAIIDEQMLDHIPRIAVVARQVETDLGSWVRELRRRGFTWSKIGQILGITRQSAWERFSEG